MTPLVEAARALRPLLREQAPAIETNRRLGTTVFDALHALGAFNLQLTAEHGGPAADPIEYLTVIEELSRGDASSGWCAMVGSESNACINAFLAPETVEAMLGAAPQPVFALTVVGAGRAREIDGGYRVSGRWRFASGCRHSTWLAALCAVHDGDSPRVRSSGGAPLTRVVFARARDAVLHDTWYTSGLRGTASDDFELDEVDIPRAHTFDLSAPPVSGAPVWRIPLGVRLAMSKAAAVCGIARGAMDALMPLLDRTPFAGAVPAREEARVQLMLAEAEAALESGRAYLYRNVTDAWQAARTAGSLGIGEIANLRLAVVSAARHALDALHLMQQLAGTGAVLDRTFDRNARDLEVARHHMQLQAHVVEDVGRVLLGMRPRNPMF